MFRGLGGNHSDVWLCKGFDKTPSSCSSGSRADGRRLCQVYRVKISGAKTDRADLAKLVLNFQEVVHSVRTGNADFAKRSDSRRTEWTPTRMPA
jgi:hypothetical protein